MEIITNILYWISTGLLVPVIVFLLFFFIKALIMIGGFYGSYVTRIKENARINKSVDENNVIETLKNISTDKENRSSLSSHLMRITNHTENPIMMDKIIGDYEIAADKELGQSKLLVKIGPMLGLMGTLIPMGPALVGLAAGDIESMANNIQVAFSTTVIGIIIGAIGYITLQVKQRWVAYDINILEYVVQSLKKH